MNFDAYRRAFDAAQPDAGRTVVVVDLEAGEVDWHDGAFRRRALNVTDSELITRLLSAGAVRYTWLTGAAPAGSLPSTARVHVAGPVHRVGAENS